MGGTTVSTQSRMTERNYDGLMQGVSLPHHGVTYEFRLCVGIYLSAQSCAMKVCVHGGEWGGWWGGSTNHVTNRGCVSRGKTETAGQAKLFFSCA